MSRSEEASVSLCHQLFDDFQIQYSTQYLDDFLRASPDFPGMPAISSALDEFGVNHATIEISIERLPQVLMPCIALLNTSKDRMVVIKKINDDNITYVDPYQGTLHEGIEAFDLRWTGVLLVAMKPDQFRSPGNQSALKSERLHEIYKIIRLGSLLLSCVLLSLLLNGENFFVVTLVVVCLTGGFFSMSLLAIENGVENTTLRWLHRFNLRNENLACFRLFRPTWPITPIELSVFYFIGGLSYAVICLACHASAALTALLPLSFIASLAGVLAFGYQLLIARQVCFLCCAVSAITVGELMLLLFNQGSNDFSLSIAGLLCHTLPVAVWFMVKPVIKRGLQYELSSQKLKTFLTVPSSLKTLLEQHTIEPLDEMFRIQHHGEGEILISLFLDGFSVQSKALFFQAWDISKELEGVRIEIVLAAGSALANQFARKVLKEYSKGGHPRAVDFLHRWYGQQRISFNQAITHEFSNDPSIDRIIDHWSDFAASGNVTYPSASVAGGLLPVEFSLNDCLNLLRSYQAQLT